MSGNPPNLPSVVDRLLQKAGSAESRVEEQRRTEHVPRVKNHRHKARPLELPRDRLAIVFQKWRQAQGRSVADLAQVSAIDVAHIWRIEQGERPNTSREVLIVLSMAMVLDVATLDQVIEVANEILDAAGLKMLRAPWERKVESTTKPRRDDTSPKR